MTTSHPAASQSVLVVDDDPDMCWSLEKLLRATLFDAVVLAGSGGEALSRIGDATFDLVILDAKLPDVWGIDLARRIHEEHRVDVPIVLISGYLYSNDQAVQDSLRSGLIFGFIAKPFFHDDVLKMARMALASKPSHVPLEAGPAAL